MLTTPIPARLASRPVIGGLVVPWFNVRLADGGVDFRVQHRSKAVRCWTEGLCQTDGQPLTRPIVFLGGSNQVRRLLFDEPGLHAECAMYATRACPMVAGRQEHYASGIPVSKTRRGKACPNPGCTCDGWTPHTEADRMGGAPAHDWYAVYCRDYTPAARPDGDVFAGAVHPDDVIKVFHVSSPAPDRTWRRTTLPDDLAPALEDT